MEWLTQSWLRLRALFAKRRLDRDLEDEFSFHLAMKEEKYRSAGADLGEARSSSHRHFGNVTLLMEACRDLWSFRFLEILGQDLRYALRVFRKSPSLTAVVVLSLALGIGANTAIFSVINALMLRSLPVRNPEELVQVQAQMVHGAEVRTLDGWSLQVFSQFRKQNHVFTDLVGDPEFSLRNVTDFENSTVELVSGNYFSVLGASARLGRIFNEDDDGAVALISYELWEREFGRDPGVLGRSIRVDHTSLTIIGVAPRGFRGVAPARLIDVWAPLNTTLLMQLAPILSNPNNYSVSVIGRRRPGVSLAQVQADLQVIFQQTQKDKDFFGWPEEERKEYLASRILVQPARTGVDLTRGFFSRPLFLLMGTVALVLLIACANVANLLVAQASVRQREINTRVALGAGRTRIVRQLLTERVLLALAGGCLGILAAWWGAPLVVNLMSRKQIPIAIDARPDLHVLAFTLAVGLITGILCGLAPGIGAARTQPGPGLKHSYHAVATSWVGKRLGKTLVIAQVALSLLLLVGAGLLLRTLKNLQGQEPGFNRQNVLLFMTNAASEGYKDQKLLEFYEGLTLKMKTLPGVRAASYSVVTPAGGDKWGEEISVEGYVPHAGENMEIYANSVDRDYFATLGTPILLGRTFGPQYTPSAPLATIISQSAARRYFAGRDPIGHQVQFQGDKRNFEIVGVAADAKYRNMREDFRPVMYVYAPQDRWIGTTEVTFEVRTAARPDSLPSTIQAMLRKINPRLKAVLVRTLSEQVDESLFQESMVAWLSGVFGAVALALACIGLYGVMAYAVARRTNEIGVRMALGAQRSNVVWLVLRNALVMVALGLLAGLAASLVATRLVAAQLYGLRATDPVTILGAVLLLTAVAAVAGYLPARRAAAVDPLIALRYE
ncbi:MAG TPA: ABC transporter permease [Candidatus Angelobacter sp.]